LCNIAANFANSVAVEGALPAAHRIYSRRVSA
jgi:hypothetical protein